MPQHLIFAGVRVRTLFLASFLTLLFAGCAALPQPKNNHFLIDRANSEFYKYGPAQAFGPDLALARGTPVILVQKEFGFSQIRLADGTTGYVSTEDLKQAPPPPAPPRIKKVAARGGRARSSNVRPTPSDPLFDVTDIPLPLPTEPARP